MLNLDLPNGNNLPIPHSKFEDEQDSYDSPSGYVEVTKWWRKFRGHDQYPLYCIILATKADQEVVELFENHREELSKLSGDKCLIVYFRDIEKASKFEPFSFEEHSKRIFEFIRILDINTNQLPCLLFFEKMPSGNFVTIKMKASTSKELMLLIRDLFGYLHKQKDVSLNSLRSYSSAMFLKINPKELFKNVKDVLVFIKLLSELI